MNIRPYLLASAFLASMSAYAQDASDALRFSYLSPQGTARSMSLGGAVGALGADFTSLSTNPAGIGVYRKSELTFTPSIKINSTQSTYQGVQTSDNNARFTINNFGLVLTGAQTGQRYERSKWKAVSFGIGVNRVADFNQNYTYSGNNNIKNGSSGAEVFSIDANNFPNDINNLNTFAGMGYQSYLLDTLGGNYVPVTFFTSEVKQQRIVQQKGGITDINISLGGNYEEKLMLGGTIGIPAVVFKRDITYSEFDATNNTANYFNSFEYSESLVTRGTGINLKLGAIYKPSDYVRLGVAFHSPTYFGLKDVTDASLSTNTENFKAELGESDINPNTLVRADQRVFEYNLLTPWRAIVSGAGIFGKYGFISAEYEYVDYASARFRYEPAFKQDENAVNQSIKNAYKGGHNFRVGLEGRMEEFAARVGFGYYGNPYKNTTLNGDGQRMNFSAGVGFRTDTWFLDLGFIHTISEQKEQPYVLNYSTPIITPTATAKNSMNNVALTVGFRF